MMNIEYPSYNRIHLPQVNPFDSNW